MSSYASSSKFSLQFSSFSLATPEPVGPLTTTQSSLAGLPKISIWKYITLATLDWNKPISPAQGSFPGAFTDKVRRSQKVNATDQQGAHSKPPAGSNMIMAIDSLTTCPYELTGIAGEFEDNVRRGNFVYHSVEFAKKYKKYKESHSLDAARRSNTATADIQETSQPEDQATMLQKYKENIVEDRKSAGGMGGPYRGCRDLVELRGVSRGLYGGWETCTRLV
ncbi:hypothetical protein FQA39_LY14591 [Lamprigera yunnana]|nr:hypothetical protein FQA39_LY14591 [Lamprigera yunnana]